MASNDAVIVGGGTVGVVTAYYLARAGAPAWWSSATPSEPCLRLRLWRAEPKPYRLVPALTKAAERLGVTVRQGRVTGLRREGGSRA